MSYDYSKLLGRLREKGFTQSELAAKIGLSECTLNKKLKSKSEFKQSEMRSIMNLMDVELDEVSSYFFDH